MIFYLNFSIRLTYSYLERSKRAPLPVCHSVLASAFGFVCLFRVSKNIITNVMAKCLQLRLSFDGVEFFCFCSCSFYLWRPQNIEKQKQQQQSRSHSPLVCPAVCQRACERALNNLASLFGAEFWSFFVCVCFLCCAWFFVLCRRRRDRHSLTSRSS